MPVSLRPWTELFRSGRKTLSRLMSRKEVRTSARNERRLGLEPLEGRLMMFAPYLEWDPTHSAGAALGGSGTWGTGSGSKWYNPGTGLDQAWVAGDTAVFAGGTGTITVASGVSVSSIDFESSGIVLKGSLTLPSTGTIVDVADGQSATIKATITGPGALTITDTGTLILTGNDTATAATTIDSGTLEIGAGGTTGSIAGNIVDQALLEFNRSNNITYNGVISGSGNLLKSGAGKLVLSGADTLSGTTTVTDGLLNVQGSLSDSNVVTTGSGRFEGYDATDSQPLTGLTEGDSYELLATWTAATTASKADAFEIFDGTTQIDTVLVDEKVAPEGNASGGVNWSDLGTWTTETGTLTVEALSEPSGSVQVAGVRTIPVTTTPTTVTQYKVTALAFNTGEAEQPVIVNSLSITNSNWITASNWQAAVLAAVSGSVVTSSDQTADFPDGFIVGYVAQFAHQAGNQLLQLGLKLTDRVIIFQGPGNAENNGNFWVIQIAERTVPAPG